MFGVSGQVRHKLVCTTTEDGFRLEISDLGSRGIVQYNPCTKNKGADQLNHAADLQLCFCICKMQVFS